MMMQDSSSNCSWSRKDGSASNKTASYQQNHASSATGNGKDGGASQPRRKSSVIIVKKEEIITQGTQNGIQISPGPQAHLSPSSQCNGTVSVTSSPTTMTTHYTERQRLFQQRATKLDCHTNQPQSSPFRLAIGGKSSTTSCQGGANSETKASAVICEEHLYHQDKAGGGKATCINAFENNFDGRGSLVETQNLHQIRSKRMKETRKPLQDYTDSTLGHGIVNGPPEQHATSSSSKSAETEQSLHNQGGYNPALRNSNYNDLAKARFDKICAVDKNDKMASDHNNNSASFRISNSMVRGHFFSVNNVRTVTPSQSHTPVKHNLVSSKAREQLQSDVSESEYDDRRDQQHLEYDIHRSASLMSEDDDDDVFDPSDQRRLTMNVKSGPSPIFLDQQQPQQLQRRTTCVSKTKNCQQVQRVSVISKNNIRFNLNTAQKTAQQKNVTKATGREHRRKSVQEKGLSKQGYDSKRDLGKGIEGEQKTTESIAMRTFQTRFSRDSSKTNILDNFSEFFVSAKSVKTKIGNSAMRRQRSEMLIDRQSHSLAPKTTNNSQHIFSGMQQNRLDVPKVVKATTAAFQKQLASSPSSTRPTKLATAEVKDNFHISADMSLANSQRRMSYQGQKNLPVNNPVTQFESSTKHQSGRPKKGGDVQQRRVDSVQKASETSDDCDSKKKPRVNDSLLLDNFLIKKKEEPIRQTLHRALLDFQSPQNVANQRMKSQRGRQQILKHNTSSQSMLRLLNGAVNDVDSSTLQMQAIDSEKDTKSNSLYAASDCNLPHSVPQLDYKPNSQPLPHASQHRPLLVAADKQQCSPETYKQFANLIKSQTKGTKAPSVSSFTEAKTITLSSQQQTPPLQTSSSSKLQSATTGVTLSNTSSGQQSKEGEVKLLKEQKIASFTMSSRHCQQTSLIGGPGKSSSSVSPVRASQSLFNVNKMKELAHMRQQHNGNGVRNSRTVDRATAQERRNGLKGQATPAHTISSLSGLRDSKHQFNEILEKMCVPTVQAYRQKEKERPFRRPTQNPRPSKGSSSASQRAAARQRHESKQRLIQQKQQQSQQQQQLTAKTVTSKQ